MPIPRSPPLRRLRRALAVSLLAHVLLILAVCQIRRIAPPPRSAAHGVGGDVRLSLGAPPRPRPEPTLPKGEKWLPVDVTPRIVEAPVPAAPISVARSGNEASGGGTTQGTPGGSAVARQGGLGLFPLGRAPASVVWVLDRSISMGLDGAIDVARREIQAGLRRLSPGTRFRVLTYNQFVASLPAASAGLAVATKAAIDATCRDLDALMPERGTNHVLALRQALALRPEVIFLVTDAADLAPADVQALTRFNGGRSAIHVVELSPHRAGRPDGPAARLAGANRGTYRHHCLAP